MKVIKRNLFLIVFLTLGFASVCYGKDFKSSVRGLQSEIETIFQGIGVIAFMLAGAMFWYSKQRGSEQLMSVIIGTIVFAASSTLFPTFMRIFG